jgi:hypothetical protein
LTGVSCLIVFDKGKDFRFFESANDFFLLGTRGGLGVLETAAAGLHECDRWWKSVI